MSIGTRKDDFKQLSKELTNRKIFVGNKYRDETICNSGHYIWQGKLNSLRTEEGETRNVVDQKDAENAIDCNESDLKKAEAKHRQNKTQNEENGLGEFETLHMLETKGNAQSKLYNKHR